jgi:hypothetical protein
MPLFALLDVESKLQLLDKTRFDAKKCFATNDATAISTLTIKAENDGSALSVYSSDTDARYLEWAYSDWEADVISGDNTFVFSEGGTEYTATVTAATYTLSQFATTLATAMSTAGGTYTASVDSDTNIVTITGADAWLPVGGPLNDFLGFDVSSDATAATAIESARVEWLPRVVTVAAGNGSLTAQKSYTIKVYSEDGDRLFSDDALLMGHKHDIMRWVPPGRASFLNYHRRAQELILAWLDEQGYQDVYNEKYTKWSIPDLDEVRQWSGAMTLRLIFQDLSNAVEDVFAEQAKEFAKQELLHRQRAILRLDVNQDGVADSGEGLGISSGTLFRR